MKVDIFNTDKKYKIIYADPAWNYKSRMQSDKIVNGKKGTFYSLEDYHYKTMSLDEIKSLPVSEISDDNSILFLWVTFPNLQEGLEVIKAWGFKYKTLGFSWLKTNKKDNRLFFGIGYYTKSNCECCLIGVKGKPPKESNYVSSAVLSPREEHSKKPDIVRDRIVELCGDVARIELFARQSVDGWDCWGLEAPEEKYRVIEDLQGSEFGMGRDYTIQEWRKQAIEWADSDENDDLISELQTMNDEHLLDFIGNIWDLRFEKCKN